MTHREARPAPTVNEAADMVRKLVSTSVTDPDASTLLRAFDAALATERQRTVERIKDRIYDEATIPGKDGSFVFDGKKVVAILLVAGDAAGSPATCNECGGTGAVYIEYEGERGHDICEGCGGSGDAAGSGEADS